MPGAAQTADGAAASRAMRRPRRDRRLKDTRGSSLVLVVGAAYPSLTRPTPRPFQAGVSGAGSSALPDTTPNRRICTFARKPAGDAAERELQGQTSRRRRHAQGGCERNRATRRSDPALAPVCPRAAPEPPSPRAGSGTTPASQACLSKLRYCCWAGDDARTHDRLSPFCVCRGRRGRPDRETVTSSGALKAFFLSFCVRSHRVPVGSALNAAEPRTARPRPGRRGDGTARARRAESG